MQEIISLYEYAILPNLLCSCILTSKSVTSLAFCSSGNLLISGSEDGAIRVWDTRTNNIIRVFRHSKGTKPFKFYYFDKYL